MMDLVLFSVIDGLIGARLMYVVINWNLYSNNIINTLKIWDGGLVFYGGLIFGSITGFTYTYFKNPDKLWEIADIFAPALAIGHLFGRIGCFFAGCCYGKETTLPWGAYFAKAPDVLRHPTQVYSFIVLAAIFLFLKYLYGKKRVRGVVFFTGIALFSSFRFFMEFLRDDAFLKIGITSLSQIIMVVIFVIAIKGLIYVLGKNNNSPDI